MMKEYFLGLRLTYSEFHRLRAMSRKSGKSKSEIVRDLLSHGYVRERMKREHIDTIRKLTGEATNLNQLAKRANTFGYSAAATGVEVLAVRIEGIIKMIKDDG